MSIDMSNSLNYTRHALSQMADRRIRHDEVEDALADGQVIRQAGGHREVRGRNCITVITDETGTVVITVLPRGVRPPVMSRGDCGVSRYRTERRHPKSRDARRGGRGPGRR
jgi:hypothetical protein